MSLFNKCLAHLRSCPSCGSNLGYTPWLCRSCFALFMKKAEGSRGVRRTRGDISVLSLADWKPEDFFMKDIVYSLKGGGLPETYTELAELFLLKHSPVLEKAVLFYPSKGKKDHAYAWACSLARLLGLKPIPLELLGQQKQALLPRKERGTLSFKPLKVPRNSQPILVDDIVTTGATAHSAWRALGQPKSFAIWSLFYRRGL